MFCPNSDAARILRGLRIAARLGLSFSKDTETAIHNHSASLTTLAKVLGSFLSWILLFLVLFPILKGLLPSFVCVKLFKFHSMFSTSSMIFSCYSGKNNDGVELYALIWSCWAFTPSASEIQSAENFSSLSCMRSQFTTPKTPLFVEFQYQT